MAANDRKVETVEVPEWGGSVCVRTLTGTEKDRYQSRRIKIVDGKQNFVLDGASAELAAMALCDEEGKRLFADAEVLILGKKSGIALQRVVDVATELNGLGANAIEDAEKNSGATQGGSSTTD